MEGTRSFYGWKVLAGSCVYLLFMMAGLGLWSPLTAAILEWSGVDLVQLTLGVSACSIIGAVGGLVAAGVIERLTPRLCMVCGSVILMLFGVDMMFVKGFLGVCIGFGLLGINCGLFVHGCVTDLLMRWFVEKREWAVAFAMGVSMFGVAVGQAISSFGYGVLGLSTGETLMFAALALGVVCLADAMLLIKNSPEEVGTVALGAGTAEIPAAVAPETTAEPVERGSALREVLTNPSFWCLVVATSLANCGISYACGYLTTFLPTLGYDFATGASFMTIMGFTAAFMMLASGTIMGKIGVPAYVTVCSAACIVTNVALLLIGNGATAVTALLWVVTIGYSLGYGLTVMHNVMCTALYEDKRVATEANTKLIAVMYGGSAIIGPLLSTVITNQGFVSFYQICIGMNVVTTACYVLAFILSARSRRVSEASQTAMA